MHAPDPATEPTAPSGQPGARGLFVLGCVSLVWWLLHAAGWALAGALGVGAGLYDELHLVSAGARLLFDAAFFALLVPFVRGLRGGVLDALSQGALVLAGANATLELVTLAGDIAGTSFLPSSADNLTSLGYTGLFVASELVYWLLYTRYARGLPTFYGPLFYALLAVSTTISLLPVLVGFEQYREFRRDPLYGALLNWGGFAIGNIRKILVLVVLWRLVRTDTAVTEGVASTRASEKDTSTSDLVIGGLFLLGGLGVTLASYAAVADGGGSYVVTTGAIVYGLFRLVRGLVRLGG